MNTDLKQKLEQYIEMNTDLKQELEQYIEEHFLNSGFEMTLVYKIKDLIFDKYFYTCTRTNTTYIIHQWYNKYNKDGKMLCVDDVRHILMDNIENILLKIHEKYANEKKLIIETNKQTDVIPYNLKLSRLREIIKYVNTGILFKEFINNYRDGYFN